MNTMIDGRVGGRVIASVVALVLTFATFDVFAATAQVGDSVVRTRTLRYDSAGLTNPVAAKDLYRRIRMSAKMVCHQWSDDSSNGRALDACMQKATDAAVASIDSAELTAVHRARVARAERYTASAG